MKSLGVPFAVDFCDGNREIEDDVDAVEKIMARVAEQTWRPYGISGARIRGRNFSSGEKRRPLPAVASLPKALIRSSSIPL